MKRISEKVKKCLTSPFLDGIYQLFFKVFHKWVRHSKKMITMNLLEKEVMKKT